MRIVLDTNVLVAGIFWSGPPSEILKRWKEGCITLVVSPEIIEEYLRVGEELGQEYPAIDASPILDLIVTSSEICIPDALPLQVCQDASDDKFIACALSSKTDFVVSGDKLLLKVSGHQGITVMKPKDFLKLLS